MTGTVKRRRQHSAASDKKTEASEPKSGEPGAGDAPQNTGRRKGLSETTIQRLLLRLAILLAAGGVYIYTRQSPLLELATTADNIGKRSQPVDCSEKYSAETANFAGCSPGRCGRLISDRIVTPQEAAVLRAIAARAFKLTGGGSGGASILDLHSGALSKGGAFINLYQLPEATSLLSPSDLAIYTAVKRRVAQFIADHFGLDASVLHLAKPTFFSRMTPAKARTVHDEYWHVHVDKETYPSFHYTSLVYLNDFGSDFKGGRFVFTDKDNNRTVEPKTGRVSAFTSGWENPHRVEPVSSGERYALTVAFTCDPAQAISDPGHVAEA